VSFEPDAADHDKHVGRCAPQLSAALIPASFVDACRARGRVPT
jgi:hypothetical protein